jgi:hypothetical protein
MNREIEVKVGQWVRNTIGQFAKVTEFDKEWTDRLNNDRNYYKFKGNHYNSERLNDADNIIKVANTPQELIQEGDLVTDETLGYLVEVIGVKGNGSLLTNEYNDGQYVYAKEVIKILTPNSNGGYDLQWEATE